MVRGSTLELMDHTYDGKEDPRTGDLRGGLGQLVDGHFGRDNFKAGLTGSKGVKGYEWLGWKKKVHQSSLNLAFAFDSVRTFHRVDIHSNNHFTKDIQVFRQARVYFSNEEDKFGDDRAVDFSYMPDLAIENARNVSINLKGEHGRYVMLQLFFNAKWILISEVTFYSEPKVDKPFLVPKITDDKLYTLETERQETPFDQVEVEPIDINIKTYPADPHNIHGTNSHSPDPALEEDQSTSGAVGIVIGVLLTVILVLLMAIGAVMHRSRASKEKRSTPTHSLLTTSTKCDRSSGGSHLNQINYTPYNSSTGNAVLKSIESEDKPHHSYEETIYEEPLNCVPNTISGMGGIVGSRSYLSTEDLTEEYAEPGGTLHLSASLSENIYAQAITVPPPPPPISGLPKGGGMATRTPKDNRLPPLPLSHYARPCTPPSPLPMDDVPMTSSLMAFETLLVNPNYRRPGAAPTPTSSSSSNSLAASRYRSGMTAPAKRRSSKSSRSSTLRRKDKSTLPTSEAIADLDNLYAQVEKTNSEQRSSLPYNFTRSASIDTVNVSLHCIPLSALEVMEKLGEGQFGEIHLCHLESETLPDTMDKEDPKGQQEGPRPVAVKFLRRDCDEVTRSDFEHEARILTSLQDPNLVRVLGICYEEDEEKATGAPLCMVCEYTSQGDLCQYLQDHVAETTLSKSPNVPTLRYVAYKINLLGKVTEYSFSLQLWMPYLHCGPDCLWHEIFRVA